MEALAHDLEISRRQTHITQNSRRRIYAFGAVPNLTMVGFSRSPPLAIAATALHHLYRRNLKAVLSDSGMVGVADAPCAVVWEMSPLSTTGEGTSPAAPLKKESSIA